MGIEPLLALHLHNLGMTETQQMERSADGAGMDRLPEPIQYEHGMFEYGIHHLSQPIVRKLAEPVLRATQKLANFKGLPKPPLPPMETVAGSSHFTPSKRPPDRASHPS